MSDTTSGLDGQYLYEECLPVGTRFDALDIHAPDGSITTTPEGFWSHQKADNPRIWLAGITDLSEIPAGNATLVPGSTDRYQDLYLIPQEAQEDPMSWEEEYQEEDSSATLGAYTNNQQESSSVRSKRSGYNYNCENCPSGTRCIVPKGQPESTICGSCVDDLKKSRTCNFKETQEQRKIHKSAGNLQYGRAWRKRQRQARASLGMLWAGPEMSKLVAEVTEHLQSTTPESSATNFMAGLQLGSAKDQSLRDRSRPLRSRFNCDRCFREHMDCICGAQSTACDGCSSKHNPTRDEDMASCNIGHVRAGRREEKKTRDAKNSKATRDRKRAEAARSD